MDEQVNKAPTCHGCGKQFLVGKKALIVMPPGFDIPEAFFHEGEREAALEFCDQKNWELEYCK